MDHLQSMLSINKPKWEWAKINSQLKTTVDGNTQHIPLKSTIAFEGRGEDGSAVKLFPQVIVDTQKSLQYENSVGWNWHKSSNMPIISIKLEIRCQNSDNIIPAPENLQAQIFAVKIIANPLDRDHITYLEDVGIRGQTNIQLQGGCGFFSGIRFMSTSYNNQGVKFYLLVILKNKDYSQPFDSIICSMMSPPIFVDSRKSARDYQEKKFMSFVELFHPGLFEKDFTKRQTKSQTDIEVKISNNLEGLFNYLTASNIRHKVKHPLFLSVKFSNAFKIMYNTHHQSFYQKQITAIDLIRKFQKKMIKEIGGEKKNKKTGIEEQKPFVICLVGHCSSHKKSKIYDGLEYLECRAINLERSPHQINQNFKDISQNNDIAKSFCEIYEQLQRITTREIQARKNQEEEPVAESIPNDSLIQSDSSDDRVKLEPKPSDNSDSECYKECYANQKVAQQQKNRRISKNLRQKSFSRRGKIEEPFSQKKKKTKQSNRNGANIQSAFNLANHPQLLNPPFHLQQKNDFGQIYQKELSQPECKERPFPKANDIKIFGNAQQSINFRLVPPLMAGTEQFAPIGSIAKKFDQGPLPTPKQSLQNQILGQLSFQNNLLQQMIFSNQVMKQKIDKLFRIQQAQSFRASIGFNPFPKSEKINTIKPLSAINHSQANTGQSVGWDPQQPMKKKNNNQS